jgi:hypothetical protein
MHCDVWCGTPTCLPTTAHDVLAPTAPYFAARTPWLGTWHTSSAGCASARALFQARFDPGNEVHARTLQAALDAQARPNECGEPDRTHSRVLACTTLMWVCAHAVWPVRSLGEWGPPWQARAVAIKPSAELAKEFAEAAMVRARVVEDACECVHVRAYAFVRGSVRKGECANVRAYVCLCACEHALECVRAGGPAGGRACVCVCVCVQCVIAALVTCAGAGGVGCSGGRDR